MKANTKLALAAAAIGGFIAYKKGVFNNLFTSKTTGKGGGVLPPPRREGDGLVNPYSFQSKVARIQSYLGAAIDGIPGPQTNLLLRDKYGLPYGNLSLNNVELYLKDLKLS